MNTLLRMFTSELGLISVSYAIWINCRKLHNQEILDFCLTRYSSP